jgi:ATP-dependent Clp protease ATP-binding subunit ClpA
VIQEEVKRPLGEELLFGKLEHGGVVVIDVDASKTVVFRYTSRAKGAEKKPS